MRTATTAAPIEVQQTILRNLLAGQIYSFDGVRNGTLSAICHLVGCYETKPNWPKDRLIETLTTRITELRAVAA